MILPVALFILFIVTYELVLMTAGSDVKNVSDQTLFKGVNKNTVQNGIASQFKLPVSLYYFDQINEQ